MNRCNLDLLKTMDGMRFCKLSGRSSLVSLDLSKAAARADGVTKNKAVKNDQI